MTTCVTRTRILLAWPIACAIAAPTLAQQAVQWRVEDGGNGHWYRYDGETQSRATAQARADTAGGHLVTIIHPAEYAFLRSAFPEIGSTMFWMGGFQTPGSCEPGCGWHWLTGEPWDYINWAPGEPNNVGNEPWLGCLADGKWNDFHSGWNIKSMIEWSVDCNGDGFVDYGQLLDGTLADANGNGVPDCCEPSPADLNEDGTVNADDIALLLGNWGPTTPKTVALDLDADGLIDANDLGILLASWGACP